MTDGKIVFVSVSVLPRSNVKSLNECEMQIGEMQQTRLWFNSREDTSDTIGNTVHRGEVLKYGNEGKAGVEQNERINDQIKLVVRGQAELSVEHSHGAVAAPPDGAGAEQEPQQTFEA